MNKKISVGAAIMFMAMTAAVTITITVVVVMRMLNANISDFSHRSAMFQKLSTVDAIVRENYIGNIDEAKLNDNLIQGYVKGVSDKYGRYLDAAAYSLMELENQGKTSGIGVSVVENTDGYIKVVSVLAGSPSQTAGIKPNDIITKIAGQDVKAMGYAASVSALRGTVGSTADFTISRGGTDIKLTLVRKSFDTQTVTSRMIGSTAYVRIIEFNDNTDEQFSQQVDSLISKGAKGIVFDVRNNPGGLLTSVENMIDKLVPAGPIVRAKYKDGKIKQIDKMSDANQVNLPMAVLTNQNTASAAELFTAALKDYNKAKSIGTKTYGKGTMQQIIDLKDGTALDLSVALFYPPISDNFEGKGVSPDIQVELTADKQNNFSILTDDQDDQLQAALGYILPLEK